MTPENGALGFEASCALSCAGDPTRRTPFRKEHHARGLLDRRFPSPNEDGEDSLPRPCGKDAHLRLPLSSAGPADRGRSPLREPDSGLAVRRPLQMAGDARQRRAGAVLHRRCRATGRNSRNGPRPCPSVCAIRSITGPTWSSNGPSASPTSCLTRRRPRASGTSAASMLAGPSSASAASCAQMNVKLVCTTEIPLDTLEHHRQDPRQTASTIQVHAGLPARQGAWRSRTAGASTPGSTSSASRATWTSPASATT